MNWKRKRIFAVPVAFVLGGLASGLLAAWTYAAAILMDSMLYALLTIMLVGGLFVSVVVSDILGNSQ